MKLNKLCYLNNVVFSLNKGVFICNCSSFGFNKYTQVLVKKLLRVYNIKIIKIHNARVRKLRGFSFGNLNYVLSSSSLDSLASFFDVLNAYKIVFFFRRFVYLNKYVFNYIDFRVLLKLNREKVYYMFHNVLRSRCISIVISLFQVYFLLKNILFYLVIKKNG